MDKYEPLWLNLGYMLPGSFDCFMDRIKLAYPEGSEHPKPLEGIHVRVPHFGKTESVEFLNSILRFGPGSYMHTIVHQLVRKGLVRDVPVRAAPYDFRLGLGENSYIQPIWSEMINISVVGMFCSITELLPSPEVFGDEVLVKTSSREFTSSEYEEVFQYADCPECLLNFHKVIKPNIKFPGVNTTCIHGVGISTPSKVEYLVDNPDGPFKMLKGDGDGTVNAESLSFCQRWNDVKDQYTFNYITIPGSNHDGLIKDTRTVEKILKYTF
ncbi:lysosomal phospholipase A and acyltransferase-like [Brevipalpus obovatus]|uniref:lysosomal phospholipase A and acyltransferase-like n=1 Tax=Brevipalpus obovatus TaxID=246614 RepID=UPI003D9EB849